MLLVIDLIRSMISLNSSSCFQSLSLLSSAGTSVKYLFPFTLLGVTEPM